MHLKPMDPALALKLIEGFENEIEPAQKVQEAFYRQQACPRCGGSAQKHFISVQHAFGDSNNIVPRSGLKCLRCDCVFDPHTGLVVEIGIKSGNE